METPMLDISITTSSPFSCQPSTDSSATLAVTYGGRAFTVAGLLTWISSLKHLCFLLPTALVFWQSSQKHSSSQSMQCIRGTGKDVLYKSTFYVTLH